MKTTILIAYALQCLFFCNATHAQQRLKLLAEGKFEGILNDKHTEQINVMVIHGTGIKPDTYADNMMAYCFKKVKAGSPDTNVVYRSEDGLITVRKISGVFEEKRKLSFYVVHWSDYTAVAKNAVHDTERNKNVNRGLISRFLKNKVLIKEFYDFVIFSNVEFKQQIKQAMDKAFDDMVAHAAGKESALNLVSGSLGSSIFIEYVNKLQFDIGENAEAFTKAEKSKFKRKIDYITDNTCRFFMLTNQVNFLESIIAQKELLLKAAAPEKSIQVVAFRHTNDALSFYLPQARAEQFVNFMPVKTINVRYKNILRGNFLMKAHTRPMELKKIYNALLFGSGYKKVKIKA